MYPNGPKSSFTEINYPYRILAVYVWDGYMATHHDTCTCILHLSVIKMFYLQGGGGAKGGQGGAKGGPRGKQASKLKFPLCTLSLPRSISCINIQLRTWAILYNLDYGFSSDVGRVTEKNKKKPQNNNNKNKKQNKPPPLIEGALLLEHCQSLKCFIDCFFFSPCCRKLHKNVQVIKKNDLMYCRVHDCAVVYTCNSYVMSLKTIRTTKDAQ